MIHTRKTFIAYFRETVMPDVRAREKEQGGGIDNPLRAESWNNLIDAMANGRELPPCARDWNNPFDRRK